MAMKVRIVAKMTEFAFSFAIVPVFLGITRSLTDGPMWTVRRQHEAVMGDRCDQPHPCLTTLNDSIGCERRLQSILFPLSLFCWRFYLGWLRNKTLHGQGQAFGSWVLCLCTRPRWWVCKPSDSFAQLRITVSIILRPIQWLAICMRGCSQSCILSASLSRIIADLHVIMSYLSISIKTSRCYCVELKDHSKR